MPASRSPSQVDFIRLLATTLGLKGAAFAKKIGKTSANTAAYLGGSKTPGNKVLFSALRHAFEWDVEPLFELEEIDSAKKLPGLPSIYTLYDTSGSAIYVGQATNLKQEVGQARQREMNFAVRLGPNLAKKEHRKYKIVAKHFSAYHVPSARMRHNLEALLLRSFPNRLTMTKWEFSASIAGYNLWINPPNPPHLAPVPARIPQCCASPASRRDGAPGRR